MFSKIFRLVPFLCCICVPCIGVTSTSKVRPTREIKPTNWTGDNKNIPIYATKDSKAKAAGIVEDSWKIVGKCILVNRDYRLTEIESSVLPLVFEIYRKDGTKTHSGSGTFGGDFEANPKESWWLLREEPEGFLVAFKILRSDCSIAEVVVREQPSDCGRTQFASDTTATIECDKRRVNINSAGTYEIQGVEK